MNRTKKDHNQQHISIHCPEEKLAGMIAEAKTNLKDIFASLKQELVQ